MKLLQALFIALLCGTSLLTAQDHYLPVSSQSAEAKTAYAKGLAHGEKVELPAAYPENLQAQAMQKMAKM